MPANTSMPTALPSEARTWTGSGWRAVEAQHRNATLGLVHGHLSNQALLEDIVEEVKPVLPAEATGLHFLLSTPFRYRAPPPSGSRFRGRLDPGGADRHAARDKAIGNLLARQPAFAQLAGLGNLLGGEDAAAH